MPLQTTVIPDDTLDATGLSCPEPVMMLHGKVRDLPAGGSRLVQRPRGYVATIKSGVVTFDHGEDTGARPGELIRGAR